MALHPRHPESPAPRREGEGEGWIYDRVIAKCKMQNAKTRANGMTVAALASTTISVSILNFAF
jgi:type III secretion system FlhB-like substrate exporter